MHTLLWILIVIAALFLISRLSKKLFKTDIYLGILIMIRTKKYIKYLDRLAKPKKLLNCLADIGIVIGFGAFGLDYLFKDKIKSIPKRVLLFIVATIVFGVLTYFGTKGLLGNNPLLSGGALIFLVVLTGLMGFSGFTVGSLIFSAYDIVVKLFAGTAGSACPGVGLVIPGVKMPKVNIFIPWYGWIILIVSAIVHEFAHGALLRSIKAKVKSMGFILATILPLGAFVEPDDKELQRKNKKSIIRMYSAGPMSNVILAAIFLIILLILSPIVSNYSYSIAVQKEDAIIVHSVQETTEICGTTYDSPAYGVLQPNDQILKINNTEIRNQQDLHRATKLSEENKFIVMNLDTNKEKIVYLTPNEMGRLGFTSNIISDPDFKIPRKYYFLKTLFSVILWTALLNFIIAIVNYLPTFPFDGGAMSQIIFSGYLHKRKSEKERMKRIAKFFGTIIVLLLLLNVIPYFF